MDAAIVSITTKHDEDSEMKYFGKQLAAMFLIALVALLISFSYNVNAKDAVRVEFGTFTSHPFSGGYIEVDSGTHKDYNETNDFISLSVRKDKVIYSMATFDNSFYERSVAIGVGYNLYDSDYLYFDVLTGVVSGYEDYKKDFPTVWLSDWAIYAVPEVGVKMPLSDNHKLVTNVRLFGNAITGSVGYQYEW